MATHRYLPLGARRAPGLAQKGLTATGRSVILPIRPTRRSNCGRISGCPDLRQETLEISTISDLRARLDAAVLRLGASVDAARCRARAFHEPVLAWASVPIPEIDPLAVFSTPGSHDDTRMLFQRPDDRFGITGIGAAWTFTCEGSGRFGRADEAWRRTSAQAVGDGGEGPIALYGFAFEDAGGEWDEYPAGLVIAPRVAVVTDRGRSRVILSAFVNPADQGPTAADATIECLTASLGSGELAGLGPEVEFAGPLQIVGEFPAQDAWKRSVAETVSAVSSGIIIAKPNAMTAFKRSSFGPRFNQ